MEMLAFVYKSQIYTESDGTYIVELDHIEGLYIGSNITKQAELSYPTQTY